ncbi:MAG: single-stranded DNA-binding protein [Leptolyngbyaceae cyanobacterium MO_188.B28]|nr:single-stranded DNA-binding protein [Leptolyngbyaceae cyanobacterium MO_188.B28]
MDPQLVAALERQNQLLERIALALERMAPAVALNYHAALESFANYDWSAIGAEVAARDADGPTVVTVNGEPYIRQVSTNQSSPALWFSRCLDPSGAVDPSRERLITFQPLSAVSAAPLPESIKREIARPQASASPPAPPPSSSRLSSPPSSSAAQTSDNLTPPPRSRLVNQNQLKRLWAIAHEYHWTKLGVHLLLREGYHIETSKDIRSDQYEQICSQLSTVPAAPYNTKAATSDPKANLTRLRALTQCLGLEGGRGDDLIKAALAEKYPGKKSAELTPPEVESVRDAMLIHHGQQQCPPEWKTVVGTQYLELVREVGAVSDEELAYRWMDKFSELLKTVQRQPD